MPYSRICVWEIAGVSCDRRRAMKEATTHGQEGEYTYSFGRWGRARGL